MKKHLLLLFLFTLVFSCGQLQQKNTKFSFDAIEKIWPVDTLNTLTISFPEKEESSFVLSEFIDSSWSITLETNPKSLIGQIDKILIHKDIIYILDIRKSKQVFAFAIDGKFLFRVGTPEDQQRYEKPYDFIIDKENQKIIVYEGQKNQLLYYSLKGKFEKKENLPYLISNFAALDNEHLICNGFGRNPETMSQDHFRLTLRTSAYGFSKKGLKYDKSIEILNYQTNKFEFNTYKNEVLFSPNFIGNIYSIQQDSLLLKYQLDFGTRQLPSQYEQMTGMEFIKAYETNPNSPYIVFTGPFYETNPFLVFHFNIGKQKYSAFYDKINHSLKYGVLRDDLAHSIEIPMFYTTYQDMYLVGCKDSYYVKKEQAKSIKYKSEKLRELLDKTKATDNPVISFYKIKQKETSKLLTSNPL